MMYYIERPNTWSPANQKCKQVQDFVDQFRNCLIPDEISRDALVEDIRHKVDELNQAYPRTKKLIVDYDYSDNYVSCYPEGQRYDNYTFTMRILPVRRTYRFTENTTLLK